MKRKTMDGIYIYIPHASMTSERQSIATLSERNGFVMYLCNDNVLCE